MKAFENYHPLVIFVYLLSVIVISMFTVNPVILALSLLGGICFCTILQSRKSFFSNLAFYIPIFILIAVTNPLFSHNGVTPLFYLNGNPVTLEAVFYGIDIALMLTAVIYWCKCYSEIMTEDKFLYLFSRAIPKLSLVLSMSIRFIPLFKTQIKSISQSQKAMGLYTSKSLVDKLKSGIRVFSSLVTWSLENAVDTSHSMKARGYGLKGRTSFSLFRFRARDGILLAVSILLLAATVTGKLRGTLDFAFYPITTDISADISSVITYIAFGILSFLPFIIEVKENLKWKYYISKI